MIQINDHVDQAINRLLYQFRYRKITIPALITIYGNLIQELENVIFELIDQRTLPATTKTAVLDLFGAAANLNRQRPLSGPAKFDNEKYRSLLIAQIYKYISETTIKDVTKILTELGATNIIIFDWRPAALQINYTGITIIPVQDIKNVIIEATAPVSLDISSYTSNPFGFAGDPTSSGFGISELGSNKE